MKLEMKGQMRMEQKMKLAPHMIQSMEILQLPLLALQERIEQELNSNPILEIEEPQTDEVEQIGQELPEKELEAETDAVKGMETFEKIGNLDGEFQDYMGQTDTVRIKGSSDEIDHKLEAIKNTAAPPQSLHEYLSEQWAMIEATDAVKKAGNLIIDYIDEKGYLSVRLEQLHNKDRKDFTFEDLQKALELVQRLEPAGVGARDLRECLLLQIDQNGPEMVLERLIISECLQELLENRLPEVSKRLNVDIEKIKAAIKRIGRLDISPGLQIGQDYNQPILADVIIEEGDKPGEYIVKLADSGLPNLRISEYYNNMFKDDKANESTKQFLQNSIRSAQWIIDAIEQRKNTLLKVAKSIVRNQKDFFDMGPLYLKPLPMAKVAEEVGVHVATVSRAVASKYVQCSWGTLPLRKFFSGGTEDENGESHSWEAIRVKLQEIIDSEDKSKPLNDDMILKKLNEAGIKNLARRTVAKYRKLMNIPPARLRKKY